MIAGHLPGDTRDEGCGSSRRPINGLTLGLHTHDAQTSGTTLGFGCYMPVLAYLLPSKLDFAVREERYPKLDRPRCLNGHPECLATRVDHVSSLQN
jgi:hypothetical protein